MNIKAQISCREGRNCRSVNNSPHAAGNHIFYLGLWRSVPDHKILEFTRHQPSEVAGPAIVLTLFSCFNLTLERDDIDYRCGVVCREQGMADRKRGETTSEI